MKLFLDILNLFFILAVLLFTAYICGLGNGFKSGYKAATGEDEKFMETIINGR